MFTSNGTSFLTGNFTSNEWKPSPLPPSDFFATRQAGVRLSRDKYIRAQECHVDVIVCEKTGPSMKKTRYSSNRSANLIVQNKLN